MLRCVVGVIVMVAWSSTAHAVDDRVDERTEEARLHSVEGDSQYKLKRWVSALQEYEQAYLAKPDPSYLVSIAECHRQLDDLAQAIRFYRRYLSDAPGGRYRELAEKRVAQLEKKLGVAAKKASEPTTPPQSSAPPLAATPPVAPPLAATPPVAKPLAATPPVAKPPAAAPPVAVTTSASPSAPASTAPPPLAPAPSPPTPTPPPATPASSSPAPAFTAATLTAEPPPASPAPAAPPQPTVLVAAAPPTQSEGNTLLEISTEPSSDEPRPLYTRWWLWTGVGAAIAGGVTAFVLLRKNDPSCPPGRVCQ